MWRVIVRLSLNDDPSSRVRNALRPMLERCGLENTGTGVWECRATDPVGVARGLGEALRVLASPEMVTLHPTTMVDYLTISVDNVPGTAVAYVQPPAPVLPLRQPVNFLQRAREARENLRAAS